jgi:hypothetical protein
LHQSRLDSFETAHCKAFALQIEISCHSREPNFVRSFDRSVLSIPI